MAAKNNLKKCKIIYTNKGGITASIRQIYKPNCEIDLKEPFAKKWFTDYYIYTFNLEDID